MKCVIFAGGVGSRISSITGGSNKHLLPIAGKPMISHVINNLYISGIDEFLIITNNGWEPNFEFALAKDSANIEKSRIKVIHSNNPEDQLGDVLYKSIDFVQNEDFLLHLGDNLFMDDPGLLYSSLIQMHGQNHIILAKAKDSHHFGVPLFQKGHLINIVEKPVKAKISKFGIVSTGLYRYTKQVFSVIQEMIFDNREVRDITAINNQLLINGKLDFTLYSGKWFDIGLPENYQEISSIDLALSPKGYNNVDKSYINDLMQVNIFQNNNISVRDRRVH